MEYNPSKQTRGNGLSYALVLELRWLLLWSFLTIIAAILRALWLDRRSVKRRAVETFADAALHNVFECAPFGWMVLESAERYTYANEYARRLLDFPAPSGPIPAVEWGFLLGDDRTDVRRGQAPEGRYRVLRPPPGRSSLVAYVRRAVGLPFPFGCHRLM